MSNCTDWTEKTASWSEGSIPKLCNRMNHEIKRQTTITVKLLLLIVATGILCSCGYKVRSSAGKMPEGIQSIGVPTFRNLTSEQKVEQLLTRAVLRELSIRTGRPVTSDKTGVDAVLHGEIRSVSSAPVTFRTQQSGSQTFGAAFLVTVQANVSLVRTRDGMVLWQNENYVYRERYVLNTSVQDFFSEENPALERLASSFAATLAGSIFDR
jgi:outer membrane lipopolysaccharide assembly protein LptE/RlpB